MAKSRYEAYSKEQLLAKIKQLEKHRYGLVWEDKLEDVAEQCEQELPVLHEEISKEIFNDAHKPFNILIEGDNYHALYTLNFTHRRKVDVIYIDPPYNTGNKDFKYNDKFVDREDNYRHSKWLSFMSKRLKLAKNLLKETGVIFISIDNNEVAQLKLLCQDIFGEDNFISDVAVINNLKGRSDDKYIATAHEHLLIFKRKYFETLGVEVPEEYVDDYKFEDLNGKYRLLGLRKRGANSKREDRPNLFYPFYYDSKENKLSLSENGFKKKPIKILPKLSNGAEGNWRWGRETAAKRIDELVVTMIKTRNEFDISQKDYLHKENGDLKRIKPKSFWMGSEFSSDSGTKALKEIISDVNFNNPKSVELIKYCLEQSAKKKSVILDFFAGSGTTAQAVLELNEADDGSRQFIICTNNENKICEEVTYPRIKKIIKGYNGNKGIPANFKYFKTSFVPQVLTDNDKRILVSRSTELLCLTENTFELVKQSKRKNEFAIYKNAKQLTAIIYDEDAINKCKEELESLSPKTKTVIYVFSYDHEYNVEDFEDLTIRFDVKPIPEAILNVYRKNSKLKRK